MEPDGVVVRGRVSWRWWWRAKEIILTVIGIAMILSQVFSMQPNDAILTAGLLMAGLSASIHLGNIFSFDVKRGKTGGGKNGENGNGE